jgi:hypothetical protein
LNEGSYVSPTSQRTLHLPFAQLLSAALLLLAPAAAHAQFAVTKAEIVEIDLEDGNIDTSNSRYTVNIRDCATIVEDNPELTFSWTFNVSAPTNTKFAIKLQPPGATCTLSTLTLDGEQEGCRLIAARDDLGGSSVTLDINAQNLLGLTSNTGCLDGTATSGDYLMSIIFTNPNDTTPGDDANDFVSDSIEVELTLGRPSAPTLDEVSAGETTVSANWTSNVESIDEYVVFYSTTELVEGTLPEALAGASSADALATSIDITSGINVGQTYYVAVANVDENGNRSALSNVLEAVTSPTRDFFEEYLAAGGVEQGGYCSSAPGTHTPFSHALPVLAAIGCVALSRRRRSRPDGVAP